MITLKTDRILMQKLEAKIGLRVANVANRREIFIKEKLREKLERWKKN